jgi:multiple sugar transport system permease protein
MLTNRRNEALVALVLVAPYVLIYGWMFVWPMIRVAVMSFTDAPLIGAGEPVGLANYHRMFADPIFWRAIWNTSYFVLLTVIPGTAVALLIALMVYRLKGWAQSLVLAAFFLPFVLPVTVVYLIWDWMMNVRFGMLQVPIEWVTGKPVNVWRNVNWFMPCVAILTIWWTNGFSILLFLAGLRNIPQELYEAAALDNATRWQAFRRVTWPLIWPITVLCLTIQLILQLKIFDQVYLFATGGRTQTTMVLVQYIYEQAFIKNSGGYGAAISVALLLIVVIFSVLQFQLLRIRGAR